MFDQLVSSFKNLKDAVMPDDQSKPSYSVWVGESQLSAQFTVASLMVRREMNRIPTARLVIFDGDPSENTFKASSKGPFRPGVEVTVKAGYNSDDQSIFTGIVIRHAIKARGTRPSELIIELKNPAVRMCVGRKNAYFQEERDHEIIDSIATTYGFKVDGDETKLEHPEMVQFNATDWDFIVTRAEKNGLLVNVLNDTIVLQEPSKLLKSTVFNTYNQGGDVFELDAEMDARNQYVSVESTAVSFDAAQQTPEGVSKGANALSKAKELKNKAQEVAGKVSDAISDFTGIDLPNIPAVPITQEELADAISSDPYQLFHGGHISSDELEDWKKALQTKSDLAFRRGRVRVQGDFRILPGVPIKLSGFGAHFDGKVLVTGICHTVNDSNFETEIQFGLSPEWFSCEEEIIATPAGGLVPAVTGLQIGVVNQLVQDPESQFRAQVIMPLVGEGEDGVWARVATLSAGEGHGTFWMPEVGDQVILGFLNDDPRDPVILGSVYDGEDRNAEFTPTDDNYDKAFITKGGHRIVFNDDSSAASMTIQTPAENTITIVDGEKVLVEDENGNKIEMTSDGITISSASNLTLEATGDIEMSAVNITATADTNATVEGQIISIDGTTTTSVKGGTLNLNT